MIYRRIPYLEIAEAVLSAGADLTAGEVWEQAKTSPVIFTRYFTSSGDEKQDRVSPFPVRGMAAALAHSIKKADSLFHRHEGEPFRYCLKTVTKMWGDLGQQADYYETLPQVDLARIIADHKPQRVLRSIQVFERSAAVIAWVRLRANHNCEQCGQTGFYKDDGMPYVEVHHLKPLSEGGCDTPGNAAALCPGCHRRLHYGADRQDQLKQLTSKLLSAGVQVIHTASAAQ